MKKILFKHPLWLSTVILVTILSALADVYFAFVIKNVVDLAQSHTDVFFAGVVKAGLFLLLAFLLAYLRKVVESLYIKRTLVSIKEQLYQTQMTKSVADFNTQNSAVYISQHTNDMTIIEQDFLLNALEVIDNIFIFSISVGSLVIINTQISLLILLMSLAPLLVPVVFGKLLDKKKSIMSHAMSDFTSQIKDLFSGYEVIKSYNMIEKSRNQFSKSNENLEVKRLNFRLLQFLSDGIGSMTGSLMHLSAIALGAYLVSKGSISFGDLLAVLQLMSFVVSPIVQIATRLNKIRSTQSIIEKISHQAFNDSYSESIETFYDNITAKNISLFIDNKAILKDFTFKFQKSKKYAIIGHSGSGKSTLLKVLMNYQKPSSGEVLIDGVNYESVDHTLYKILAPIHQNVYMFDASISDNVSLYKSYSKKAINDSLEKAQLIDLLGQKKDGIHSGVGENGKLLSGGERQRISIARAFLVDPPIIMCDEATSALDEKTSKLVMNHILQPCKTVISVTHNIDKDLLETYDHVLILEEGQLVAHGPFQSIQSTPAYLKLKNV